MVGRLVTLGGTLSPERITAGSAITTLLFTGALFAIRRRILWNAFNKRLIALAVTGMLLIVAHRLVAIGFRTPPNETMTIDLVIVISMGFYAAYAFIPRFVVATVPIVIGLLGALVWPTNAPAISVIALAISAPITAIVLLQAGKPLTRAS